MHSHGGRAYMSDTIELLEAIGRDASLRHASAQSLAQALAGMDANAGLKLAAASGDRSHLVQEFGNKSNTLNQNPPAPNGGCDPMEEDMEDGADEDGGERDCPHDPDSAR